MLSRLATAIRALIRRLLLLGQLLLDFLLVIYQRNFLL